MKDIFNGLSLLIGVITIFLIALSLFVLFASKNFITFLLGIPLSYIWSIGFFACMLYLIKVNGGKK